MFFPNRFILQPPKEIKNQLDSKMKASEEKIESLQVCNLSVSWAV